MKRSILLLLTASLPLTLAACAETPASPPPSETPSDPSDPAPGTPTDPTDPGTPTDPSTVALSLTPTPDLTVREREWDTEFDFASTDWEAIYAFYDQDIQAQGWTKTGEELDDDEYDADYSRDGLRLELQVDLEDGYTEVQIDIDEIGVEVTGAAYSLYELPGLTLNLFPDTTLRERNWDIEVEYTATPSDLESVFSNYDALLQEQGWTQTGISTADDEIEATYTLGSARLELDVDVDGSNEIDVNIDLDQVD
jgi:hypothetical protein